LTNINEYESLWREAWHRVETALDSFAKGASRVQEFGDAKLSLVTLAPEIFSPAGFKPTRHSAPFTAISHHAHGEVFLIATTVEGGWTYRIDYPYYSWAETVVRPKIKRRDLSALLTQLNDLEMSATGKWRLDSSEMTSAAKFSDEAGKLATSGLGPDIVSARLREALLQSIAAAV
jgi:hypothetical protein